MIAGVQTETPTGRTGLCLRRRANQAVIANGPALYRFRSASQCRVVIVTSDRADVRYDADWVEVNDWSVFVIVDGHSRLAIVASRQIAIHRAELLSPAFRANALAAAFDAPLTRGLEQITPYANAASGLFRITMLDRDFFRETGRLATIGAGGRRDAT